MNDSDVMVCLITVPTLESAEKIALSLVERHLAACVNIVPGVKSIYRWKGEIQDDAELLLVVKTARSAFQQLKSAVIEMHPYQLPEIIGVGVEDGLAEYLSWVEGEVTKELDG